MVDVRYKTTLEKINLIKPEQVYFGTKMFFWGNKGTNLS
jgi:hypothetical protein